MDLANGQATDLLAFVMITFLIVTGRYLLMAWGYERLIRGRRAIQQLIRGKAIQIKREVVYAAVSSLLFAILAAGTYVLYSEGLTRVYTSWDEYPLWYFLISIPIVLFAYETYYYWLHRWMHRKSVFKFVHRVHHQSVHPTVFTSFAFHPAEALLQFIFFPVLIIIMPIHYLALGIVLMLFTISAVVNHAGAEVFPEKFYRQPSMAEMADRKHPPRHTS